MIVDIHVNIHFLYKVKKAYLPYTCTSYNTNTVKHKTSQDRIPNHTLSNIRLHKTETQTLLFFRSKITIYQKVIE